MLLESTHHFNQTMFCWCALTSVNLFAAMWSRFDVKKIPAPPRVTYPARENYPMGVLAVKKKLWSSSHSCLRCHDINTDQYGEEGYKDW